MPDDQAQLIESLQSADAYPHPARSIELIETHISWVLLTGEFAYKIKKAVQLPFLDFSTLELRERFCRDELSLNRRLAREIYCDVVPIGGSASRPRVGDSPAIEYAVKMRQFPAESTADRMIARDALDASALRGLAGRIARFHESLEGCRDVDAYTRIGDNLDELLALPDAASVPELAEVAARMRDRSLGLRSELGGRCAAGFVRECHGDLHLGNLAWLEQELVPFDCLEFDRALRTIDVIDEAAFLFMDLCAHRRSALAFEFLDSYLEHTGDYAGLSLLRCYAAHRALVRAKVALIGHRAATADSGADAQSYLRTAHAQLKPPTACLLITCGLSASGKSSLSGALVPRIGAVRVRSDVERKRLHGIAAGDRSRQDIGRGLYSPAASDATYARLAHVATAALEGAIPIIVDAAFLSAARRDDFAELARSAAAPFLILRCDASEQTLRERIRRRLADREEPSDADEAVLEHQLATAEPIASLESKHTLAIDTEQAIDFDALARTIAARLQVSLSSTST